MEKQSKKQLDNFIATVMGHYEEFGRSLPWRQTNDPYCIMVSEYMLQQTQVKRVLSKYTHFITTFPDIHTLSSASLGTVIQAWQGLGYNRRAKALHETADIIVNKFDGCIPEDIDTLKTLPGIGPATAGEIAAFAFGIPTPIIETNIRTVFIHHFFPDAETVHDKDLLPLIELTLDNNDPRTWYYALMDYGVYLKKKHPNPSRKSSHHNRQSPFEGSDRQIRGAILRLLSTDGPIKRDILIKKTHSDPNRAGRILASLVREGMVITTGTSYISLPQ
jgi:A/G-specific adenine glycosylase